MAPKADPIAASWALAPAQPAPARGVWARAQRGLKEFLLSAPEDALVAEGSLNRSRVQLASIALLTVPLAFTWLPAVPLGRWSTLFCVVTGLIAVAWVEAADRVRPHPFAVLLGGSLYAATLSGVAWEVLGSAGVRVSPESALAAVSAGLALLAVKGDPRLCLAGAGVGVLTLSALGSTPAIVSAVAVGCAGTLAAARGRLLRRLSILDAVSGALNDAAFERCLLREHEQARATGRPFTLARIEFSALGEVRETIGIELADALLRWLASRLGDRFRATDLLGRTAANELSILLRDTDHPGALRRIEEICGELATIELHRGDQRQPLALQTAFGAAAAPREGLDLADLQKLASRRLALARRTALVA